MKIRTWRSLLTVAIVMAAAAGVVACELPMLGASGLLPPARHHVGVSAPKTCEEANFAGAGVVLNGWRCRAGSQRATLVYLHGIADNRTSGAGIIERFGRRWVQRRDLVRSQILGRSRVGHSVQIRGQEDIDDELVRWLTDAQTLQS